MYKILPTAHVLSRLGLLFSVVLLIPAALSYAFSDDAFSAFLTTALITMSGSYTVWLSTLRFRRELRPRDGFTLVLMLWLAFAFVAAIPIYLYLPQISFTDAFFEAMSGLTTTGATTITHLDTLAPSINFWRHLLNWLGGMGIIVLAVAILPMLGVGGTQLFKAEIPGLDKENKMAPRISQVAKKLWFAYILTTLAAIASLHLAGMGWFDALCHALSAVSLGGFSTHNDSIAYYDSPVIESVVMFFTVWGGINFASHFAALNNRSLKTYWKDEECRTMLLVLFGSILISALYLWQKNYYPDFMQALRYTSFNFVSIGLASGFSNTDFEHTGKFGFDGRGHKKHTRPRPVQIQPARNDDTAASQSRPHRQSNRQKHTRPPCPDRHVLHLHLLHDHHPVQLPADGKRHGIHLRLYRRYRLHHQCRPGIGRNRAGKQLCRIERHAKMALCSRHAFGPAGNLYRPHPPHPCLLEEIKNAI